MAMHGDQSQTPLWELMTRSSNSGWLERGIPSPHTLYPIRGDVDPLRTRNPSPPSPPLSLSLMQSTPVSVLFPFPPPFSLPLPKSSCRRSGERCEFPSAGSADHQGWKRWFLRLSFFMFFFNLKNQ